MIGWCKLCFMEMDNDGLAKVHFEEYHKVMFFESIITIEELIQD